MPGVVPEQRLRHDTASIRLGTVLLEEAPVVRVPGRRCEERSGRIDDEVLDPQEVQPFRDVATAGEADRIELHAGDPPLVGLVDLVEPCGHDRGRRPLGPRQGLERGAVGQVEDLPPVAVRGIRQRTIREAAPGRVVDDHGPGPLIVPIPVAFDPHERSRPFGDLQLGGPAAQAPVVHAIPIERLVGAEVLDAEDVVYTHPVIVVLRPEPGVVVADQPSHDAPVQEAGADEVVADDVDLAGVAREMDLGRCRRSAVMRPERGIRKRLAAIVDRDVIGVDHRRLRLRLQEGDQPGELLGMHEVVGRGPRPVLARAKSNPLLRAAGSF